MILNVGAGGASTAEAVQYDNTESGLEATEVQGAVDEVAERLTNENEETFNFGVKDGVRGFYTNPSRGDDTFIPFSSLSDKVLNAATEILLTYKNTLTTSEEYTIEEDGDYLVNLGNRFTTTGGGTATGNLYVNDESAYDLSFTSTGNNSVQNTAITHHFSAGDIIKFSMKNANSYTAYLLMSLYKI